MSAIRVRDCAYSRARFTIDAGEEAQREGAWLYDMLYWTSYLKKKCMKGAKKVRMTERKRVLAAVIIIKVVKCCVIGSAISVILHFRFNVQAIYIGA